MSRFIHRLSTAFVPIVDELHLQVRRNTLPVIDLTPLLSFFILNDPSGTQHPSDLLIDISAQVAAVERNTRQVSSVSVT
ncbi:hypothetical protein D3C71_1662510 [compost metagenome]